MTCVHREIVTLRKYFSYAVISAFFGASAADTLGGSDGWALALFLFLALKLIGWIVASLRGES